MGSETELSWHTLDGWSATESRQKYQKRSAIVAGNCRMWASGRISAIHHGRFCYRPKGWSIWEHEWKWPRADWKRTLLCPQLGRALPIVRSYTCRQSWGKASQSLLKTSRVPSSPYWTARQWFVGGICFGRCPSFSEGTLPFESELPSKPLVASPLRQQ